MTRRHAALLVQAGVLQALIMPRQPPIKTALKAAPDMEDLTRRVFCSRELNMANIEAVGFDMDYTLAQYNEAFDMLAFEGAKDKLVDMGYPEEAIRTFKFDPLQHTRGLVIDKRRGNILKWTATSTCGGPTTGRENYLVVREKHNISWMRGRRRPLLVMIMSTSTVSSNSSTRRYLPNW